MGAPLFSENVTPSWRRWRRAWLERPRRVSKYVPQTSQMTGCGLAWDSMGAKNVVFFILRDDKAVFLRFLCNYNAEAAASAHQFLSL